MFDGSKNSDGAGARIVIQSLRYKRIEMSFKFYYECTNNQAEYESLIIDLEIILKMGASTVHIKGILIWSSIRSLVTLELEVGKCAHFI